ncbi:hypothetical protein QYM36_014540 [Artemia franciscana]|uniref:Uncharacterized protein n=1 Tax=Artemia franciscana TaxID=6661 RepID=A0AA88HNK1_ARTSF|nr:hypothetical protein QYM36_014540 [Artemia franciscana]
MEALKAISKTNKIHSPINKLKHCPACLIPFSYGNFIHTLKQPKSANSKLRRLLRQQKEQQLNSKERKKLKYLKKKSRNLVIACLFCKQKSNFHLERDLPELANERKESVKKKVTNIKAESAMVTGTFCCLILT